jgi:hypothetical protein
MDLTKGAAELREGEKLLFMNEVEFARGKLLFDSEKVWLENGIEAISIGVNTCFFNKMHFLSSNRCKPIRFFLD